jgi:uncharacterized membrane protein
MPDVADFALLSVINWLHLFAMVIWFGGFFTNILVLVPSLKESLEPAAMGPFMGTFSKRFRRLVYLSIVVLLVTGVVMLLLNKEYLGLLDLGNEWSILMLIKHIFVLTMIGIAVYMFEVVFPKIGRLAAKGPSPELARVQKLQIRLGIVGFVVALAILAFTAVTTAISALP